MLIILAGVIFLIFLVFVIFLIAKQSENNMETNASDILGNKTTPAISSEEKRSPAFHLFLYLVSFLSLGFVVAGILINIFQFVNKHLKEELDLVRGVSVAVDQGSLKFAIAALIVAGPIYFAVLYFINKKLANKEIPAVSSIRKFITYIALFIFSGMGIGSLINLIYNYLEGELSQRAFIKIIAFFLVSIFFGIFYLWEIRRKEFVSKAFLSFYISAIFLAVLALILGFTVVDSPQVTRQKKIDREVVNRMMMVNGQISSYQAENDRLPDADRLDIPEGITYRITEGGHYELCATFRQPAEPQYVGDEWSHPAGEHCFRFDKDINTPKGGLRPLPALID